MSGPSRQHWMNAALVVIALALVVIVFATRERMTTSEQEARENNLLQDFDETKITRVRLERKEDSFTIVRTKASTDGAGEWKIQQPVVEDAEPFAVQKLLGTLEFATAVRHIRPEDANRASFGLDSPELVVHVDMGEIKYRLRVGNEAASPKGAHYLEIAGENAPGKSVVLVSKSLLDELRVKLDDFRERYVMPYLSTAVSRIVLEGEGGTRRLKRGAARDSFRFDGMLGDVRLSRAGLERILVQFGRTRADRFLDAAEAEKLLSGAPSVTVTMTPIDGKQPVGVVVIGGRCPGTADAVVALRQKPDRVAACVPSTVLTGLSAPAESLVDRTLFWMRPDEVERFDIERSTGKLSLERKESAFVMRAPREEKVETEAGTDRLESLLHATGKVVESPDRGKLGLESPSGKATLHSAAADDSKVMVEEVAIGRAGDDGALSVQRLDDGAVLVLERDAARALGVDTALLRSRTILDVPIADVAGVELEGPVRQALDRAENGTITLRAPSGFDVDSALALELCDALRGLTADRWVAEADDGSFGLGSPSVTARLSVRKGDALQKHVLRIGRPASSGYYASVEDQPGVFTVPRRLYETLSTWVVDRSVFLMDPQATHRIALVTADRHVVLENQGGVFIQTDSGAALSPDGVQRIVETLGQLRAEAAVDLGPPKAEYGLGSPVLTIEIEREPAGPSKAPQLINIGAGDTWRGISVHYASIRGVPATYALARSSVRAILDSL